MEQPKRFVGSSAENVRLYITTHRNEVAKIFEGNATGSLQNFNSILQAYLPASILLL
jgi:hypothetical protein